MPSQTLRTPSRLNDMVSRLLSRGRARTMLTSDDRDLQQQAAQAGCGPLSGCVDRDIVTVHGELRSVTLRPNDGVTALEAELYDGSDSLTLIWLGRRRIEGIVPGRQLTVHGRLGRRRDERIVYNPRYDLA